MQSVQSSKRGAILRLASRLEGRAFDATEVLDISFDEAFPQETFVLDLPGIEFGRVDRL